MSAYSAAQIQGLRAGVLTAGVIALGSFLFTRNLPAVRMEAGGGVSRDPAG